MLSLSCSLHIILFILIYRGTDWLANPLSVTEYEPGQVMGRLFQLQENCLRLMGHNDNTEATGTRLTIGLRHVASLFLVMSAEYPILSYVIYHIDDMELITACLSVAFTNLLTVIKISTFLIYKRHFWQLMQSFRRLYRKCKCVECIQMSVHDYQLPCNWC